jgi:Domain of unknown function (DUF4337)
MLKSLEHHEHAEHLAHGHGEAGHGHDPHAEKSGGFHGGGGQRAALLVAVLAAALAITEQGAKHAEIRVQENSILAADAWSQYQGKSTRATLSKDVSDLIGTLGAATPEVMAQRAKVLDGLKQDRERYESDPKDGKGAVADRAKAFEHEREHSLEQTHTYHNGAAGMELGIVLATASAITQSRMLIWAALGVGLIGVVFAVLGWVAPELGTL